jgi:hypothetical protein
MEVYAATLLYMPPQESPRQRRKHVNLSPNA